MVIEKRKLFKTKLKGSSLIEVLAALSIILTCFISACLIYVNISTSVNATEKLEALLLIKELSIKTKKEKEIAMGNEAIETTKLSIEKNVTSYANSNKVLLLDVKAKTKSGKIILEHKELINNSNKGLKQ